MEQWLKLVQALVRPFLTIFGLVYLCDLVSQGRDVPEFFVGMVGGMLMWWFADRSLFHKKEREK